MWESDFLRNLCYNICRSHAKSSTFLHQKGGGGVSLLSAGHTTQVDNVHLAQWQSASLGKEEVKGPIPFVGSIHNKHTISSERKFAHYGQAGI